MAMKTCSVCEEEQWEDLVDDEGICESCRKNFAIPRQSPALRPLTPCRRCGGRVIVRCRAIRERGASGGDYVHAYIAPLAATFARATRETLFRKRTVEQNKPDLAQPAGVFEAYICRACGLTEIYTRDPETIPIGPEYATELIEVPSGETPFR
ncbi:MAG: hypothetical protein KC503_23635 [Myxococcales bacterium]|nr:hypothetical protein [Myxococcales bacterium]